MLKLRQISVALTLALVFCFTALGSGAFAQGIEQGSPNTTAVTIGVHALTQQATTQQVNLPAANQTDENGAYDGWHYHRYYGWRHRGWHHRGWHHRGWGY